MKRTGILTTAEKVVHEERGHYAPPLVDFARAAEMLNALGFRRWQFEFEDIETPVGLPLGPSDIPVMMICVKLSRLAHQFDVDGLIDIAGYVETWGIIQDIFPEEG